jgi:hypoxanthine phosphoribosyltransferase
MKKKYVSFQKVKQNLVDINSKINQTNWKPDIILSVNRGGCVPGVFLSHMRDLDHEVLSFKNNININNDTIKNIMSNHLSILIIDDINDSGNTLADIKKKFNRFIKNIKFAVLINNKSSSFEVDYYGSEIDKNIDNRWIVFPWEKIDAE